MKFKIYQIDMDRDKNRVKFDNLENTKKHQGFEQIDAGIYNRVFMGDTDSETLEDIYRLFNTESIGCTADIPCLSAISFQQMTVLFSVTVWDFRRLTLTNLLLIHRTI